MLPMSIKPIFSNEEITYNENEFEKKNVVLFKDSEELRT